MEGGSRRRSRFGHGVYQDHSGNFYARLVRGGGTKQTRRIKTEYGHATAESARKTIIRWLDEEAKAMDVITITLDDRKVDIGNISDGFVAAIKDGVNDACAAIAKGAQISERDADRLAALIRHQALPTKDLP